MKRVENIALLLPVVLWAACGTTTTETVVDAEDYHVYLNNSEDAKLNLAEQELKYWNGRFEKAPNQVSYLGKIADAHSLIFERTANIDHLKMAEKSLELAIEKTASQSVGYLHSLARNYISQHRFKEALALLKTAEEVGDKKHVTDKMFFDVYLELGEVEKAEHYLNTIFETGNFDYLIRLAKWEDHNGNLDKAILQMEKAKNLAEASGYEGLMLWSYTNLADFYGHAGRIGDSYEHYLKALKIDPSYSYALKGIAWIAFSNDNNSAEAKRIIKTIQQNHPSPDMHLFLADIAEYEGDFESKNEELEGYFADLNAKADAYGDMYNSYNIELLADESSKRDAALALAQKEIENRATAQSYDLLAWAHFKNGETAKATQIMEQYVENRTSEPVALYHLAEIYSASGQEGKAKALKGELLASLYELGPNMKEKIERL